MSDSDYLVGEFTEEQLKDIEYLVLKLSPIYDRDEIEDTYRDFNGDVENTELWLNPN